MTKLRRREVLGGTGLGVAAGLLPVVALAEGRPGKANKANRVKVLVAGGHPDDPESGCGGTVCRYTSAGHEVVVLYFTGGEGGIKGEGPEEARRIRTAEAKQACQIMGARPRFVGQIDGQSEVTNTRYDELRKILEEEKPDLVLTHWPVDTHRDHRHISLLVHDAWRRMKDPFALFYFEVLLGSQTQNFHPTHHIDITPVLEQKKKACLVHVSQEAATSFWPDHEVMQRFRGKEHGVAHAEAFIRHARNKDPLPGT